MLRGVSKRIHLRRGWTRSRIGAGDRPLREVAMAAFLLPWHGFPPVLRVALFAAVSCLGLFASARVSSAQTPIWPGRWTNPSDSGAALFHTPVHMALLPSDSSGFHSTLLWWNSSGIFSGGVSELAGRALLWRSVQDTFMSFPQSNFVERAGSVVNIPGDVNVFCAGHA